MKWQLFKPLAEEVIEVFRTMPEVKKLGVNDEDPNDPYHFLKIKTLCDAIRDALFARGIMFLPVDKDVTFEQISEGRGQFSERCVVLTSFAVERKRFGLFTERAELGTSAGMAKHHSDKALAIAQTAAFKAFLKRTAMQYGQEDDPETSQKRVPDFGPGQPTAKESVRVASYQKRALDAALRDSGVDRETLGKQLSQNLGFEIDVDDIAKLPRVEFDQAMSLILWGASVEDAKAKRGPQPVVNILDAKRTDEIAGD